MSWLRQLFCLDPKGWTERDEAEYQVFVKIEELNRYRVEHGLEPLESYAEGFERIKAGLWK